MINVRGQSSSCVELKEKLHEAGIPYNVLESSKYDKECMGFLVFEILSTLKVHQKT